MAKVQTVLGEISPDDLGRVLPHEHTFFHWLGAEADHDSSYDNKEVVQKLSEQVSRWTANPVRQASVRFLP